MNRRKFLTKTVVISGGVVIIPGLLIQSSERITMRDWEWLDDNARNQGKNGGWDINTPKEGSEIYDVNGMCVKDVYLYTKQELISSNIKGWEIYEDDFIMEYSFKI